MATPSSTVWITGASSGIGAALARVAGRSGHRLILSARRVEHLESVRATLPHPDQVKVLPLDVADHAALGRAAREAESWGGVDILVNNAGITQRSTALETTVETARRIMEVNYFASVELSRAVLPGMLSRDRGHLVFVSSVAGWVATPLRSSYSAAKHAVRAWADALRAELHGSNVAVTVLCPGYIATGISSAALLGDGTPQGFVEPTDAGGLDVDVAAAKMWRAIEDRRPEVLVGGKELAAVYLKRWAPGLVTRLLPRFTRS